MKECPYCAEKIQDDAVKCRYCGEFLKRKKFNLVFLLLVALLLFVFIIAILYSKKLTVKRVQVSPREQLQTGSLVLEKTQEDEGIENIALKSGVLSGHAYTTLGSGESYLQRGMKVYLIPDTPEFNEKHKEVLSIEKNVRSTIDRMISEVQTAIQSQGAFISSEEIGRYSGMTSTVQAWFEYHSERCELFYSKSAKMTTEVGFDGAYKFENLPPGDYYIYAKYRTAFNEGYWLVPVNVKEGNVTELDINNNNLYNEKDTFQSKSVDQMQEHLVDVARIKEGNITAEQLKLYNLEGKIKAKEGYYRDLPYPEPVQYKEKDKQGSEVSKN